MYVVILAAMDNFDNGEGSSTKPREAADEGPVPFYLNPVFTKGFLFAILILLSELLVSNRYLTRAYNWPNSVEQHRYLVLQELFNDSMSHGVLFPRWLPDLFSGYGYPTFIFYPPGYFYFSAAVWAPLDVMSGVFPMLGDYMVKEWITLIAILTIGGYGAFLLSERLS